MASLHNSPSIPTISFLKTTSFRISGFPTDDQSKMITEVDDQPAERGEDWPIEAVEEEAWVSKGKPPRYKHGANVSATRASM